MLLTPRSTLAGHDCKETVSRAAAVLGRLRRRVARARAECVLAAAADSASSAGGSTPLRGRVRSSLRSSGRTGLTVYCRSLGGMCGAIVTAPFDLIKTRLQSDLFQTRARPAASGVSGVEAVAVAGRGNGLRSLLWNFADTGLILRCVRAAKDRVYARCDKGSSPGCRFQGRLEV